MGRMYDREYNKTYKPFVAWLIGYPVVAIIAGIGLSEVSIKVSVMASLMILVVSLYILILIIYRGEYVYWINGGPSFEEARSAGSEKRKEYAKAHLDIFFRLMLVSLFYGIISLYFEFSIWIDILIITLLVIRAGFSSIPIKFNS